jgi:phage terminase large subunit-like protein
VIGVDPALTSNVGSDETGIIVAGMDGFGKAYVLDDLSLSAPPEIWAKRAAEAYRKHFARLIVIESNAGGELLPNLLRSVDSSVKVKTVYARESKTARAEPIVVLYQKKAIFHARQFHKLEMQMATYEPRSKSPDRLDAMVWAMTELFNVSSGCGLRMPGVFTVES